MYPSFMAGLGHHMSADNQGIMYSGATLAE
jgi:hypothetical protein